MAAIDHWDDKLNLVFPDQGSFSPKTISLAACSFVACTILLLPLAIKIRAQNIPLSTILGSVLVYTLFRGINALIWSKFDISIWQGQGLCDVEVKLFPAFEVAVSGGLLCLFRQLSRMMKTSRLGIEPSKSQKRRTLIFDIFFCIVLPILSMPASFIVQPGRYAITPVQVCSVIYYPTPATYFLLLTWPAAISLIAMVYAATATLRMVNHYNQLSRMFADLPHGSRVKRDIIRTYIFALIVYVVRFPLMLYSLLIRNRMDGMVPFSWSDIHTDDWAMKIYFLPFESKYEFAFSFTSLIFAGLAVYCFGAGQDVKEEIRRCNAWLRRVTKK